MTKDELLAALAKASETHDTEVAHIAADDALLAFIADEDIEEAFRSVPKWYA